ncbi:AraC family transcriptional regulator [Aquitalea sp. ASV15]|uniref:AraC family transcriptional regulator n=1 Tax=Aquitalea sp. ASV15 TaxID=2795104 RepID=UPI0018EBFBCC|nr:AraC family transcriptional regulator [Aquitalea sp. ASV15]
MAERIDYGRSIMQGIHAMQADSSRTFARHSHEEFGIGLIVRGAQRSFSGRGTVEAGPGDLIMVNPGEVHDGQPLQDGGRAWRMLYIQPALWQQLAEELAEHAGSPQPLLLPQLSDAGLRQQFVQVFALLCGQAAASLPAEQAMLQLLSRLLPAHGYRPPSSGCSAAIARVRALLDDAPTQSHSLSTLAELAGISRFRLLRSFSQQLGCSPHDYLQQRRLSLARGLIAQGRALAEVAAAVGFADQSHMNRVFLQRLGITPGRYARALR